jgi:hypothetical protein
MFESRALAAALLFVFWYVDEDPVTGVGTAAVLAIGNSVIGWSFWLALGAAVSLVAPRGAYEVNSVAVVGVLNVAQAIGLLLLVRVVPLVT